MAWSVEARSPFLDYRIIEFARSLPINYRYKDGVTKRIVRDILEEYIPREVFSQPKKGFSIPLGDWIRGELKKDIESSLSDEFLNSIPNLDVAKFKKQLQYHMDSRYDYSFSIWKIFILYKWTKEFNLKF